MKADKVINIHNLLSNWIKFLLSLIKLNFKILFIFKIIDYTVSRIINESRNSKIVLFPFYDTSTKPLLPDRLSEKPIIGGAKFIGLIFRLLTILSRST